MKKLFLILLFFLFTCTIPQKEIVVEKDNSKETNYKLLNKKIYPTRSSFLKLPSFSKNVYAGNGNGYIDIDAITKQNDFIAGTFYFDNSINSNDPLYQDIWRTLDLSGSIGNQTHKVTLYIKVISSGTDGADELAIFMFRTPNINFAPKIVTQKISDVYWYTIEITTNDNAQIEWCYAGSNPYDAKTIDGNPEYHSYRWLTCEIWLYESWKIDVINSN